MNNLSGPKRIIDLDSATQDNWKVDRNAVHLYQQQLWSYITTGCVLCAEADRNDAAGQTLQSNEDEHVCVCLTHGLLVEFPYKIRRDVMIIIGDFEHKGTQEIDGVILLPHHLTLEERNSLILQLINQVATDETQKDILSDD